MKNEHFEFFERLGLTALASEKDVKRAYARLLKGIDRQSQASEFILLRQDYEAALNYIAHTSNSYDAELYPVHKSNADSQDTAPAIYIFESDHPLRLQKLMEQFVTEIVENNNKCGQVNPYFLSDLIKNYFAKDELINLDDRIIFENFIAQQLVDKKFGVHFLRLLYIFSDYFAWTEANLNKDSNLATKFLVQLIDQINSTSYEVFELLTTILQTPDSTISKLVLKKYATLYAKNSVLFDICVPTEQMNAWKETHSTNYVFFRLKFFLRKYIKLAKTDTLSFFKVSIRQVIKIAFYLAVILLLVNKFLSPTEKQNTLILQKCDQIYSNAIDKNWTGLSLRQTNQLIECAKTYAPQTCESREKFVDLISATTALYPYSMPKIPMRILDDVYINTNGMHYFLNKDARCSDVADFALNMNWNQSNDQKALSNLIPVFENCKNHVIKHQSPGLYPIFNSVRAINLSNLFANTDVSIYAHKNAKGKEKSKELNQESIITVQQILTTNKPYRLLSESEIRNDIPLSNENDILGMSDSGFSKNTNYLQNQWSNCVPLKDIFNIEKKEDSKMGPLEKAIEKKRFALQQ